MGTWIKQGELFAHKESGAMNNPDLSTQDHADIMEGIIDTGFDGVFTQASEEARQPVSHVSDTTIATSVGDTIMESENLHTQTPNRGPPSVSHISETTAATSEVYAQTETANDGYNNAEDETEGTSTQYARWFGEELDETSDLEGRSVATPSENSSGKTKSVQMSTLPSIAKPQITTNDVTPERSIESEHAATDLTTNTTVDLTTEQTQPSEEVQFYLGKRVKMNTDKSNRNGLARFGRFIINRYGKNKADRERALHYNEMPYEEVISLLRRIVFVHADGRLIDKSEAQLTEFCQKRVRHFLREWVVHARKSKSSERLHPTTMRGYIHAVQRGVMEEWGLRVELTRGPIFNCPKEGLLSVCDNLFAQQQAQGCVTVSKNILTADDITTLYKSHYLSKDTAKGFQRRLVFNIALATANRPTEIWDLDVGQFSHDMDNGRAVWRIKGKIGSNIGSSKTTPGGWHAVGKKVKEITIWDEWTLNGLLNIYKDISLYMRIREGLNAGTTRFFLGTNRRATHLTRFFSRQHLGEKTFKAIIRDTCKYLGIRGVGENSHITTHSIRTTVSTRLLDNGHDGASVVMRTGHKKMESLKNYGTLRGALGKRQMDDILPGSESTKRSKCDAENPKPISFPSTDPSVSGAEVHLAPTTPLPDLAAMISRISTGSNCTVHINIHHHQPGKH